MSISARRRHGGNKQYGDRGQESWLSAKAKCGAWCGDSRKTRSGERAGGRRSAKTRNQRARAISALPATLATSTPAHRSSLRLPAPLACLIHQVAGHVADEQLDKAIVGSDAVIIPAGVPRQPGCGDFLSVNAGIVKSLFVSIAKCCPDAVVYTISNLVKFDSVDCMTFEVFQKDAIYDEKMLFIVTTCRDFVLDLWAYKKLRFLVHEKRKEIATPASNDFSYEDIKVLTKRIQDGKIEVVDNGGARNQIGGRQTLK
ncbi:malate dehydrogenase, mitochondrial [Canna indica]|uniref:malate dehydrogenase n=1 Tax=Canna indica TaxID=4628 RepID=A0AAQ3PZQ4_9LILI|nr:malate dehydrogenase, mitochondrial [Canna indica]